MDILPRDLFEGFPHPDDTPDAGAVVDPPVDETLASPLDVQRQADPPSIGQHDAMRLMVQVVNRHFGSQIVPTEFARLHRQTKRPRQPDDRLAVLVNLHLELDLLAFCRSLLALRRIGLDVFDVP